MVRSIVFPRVLGKSLDGLQPALELFRALGFAPGNEWHEGGNHGVEMLGPRGGIEFIAAGDAPSVDVMVEVADADLAYEIVKKLTLASSLDPTLSATAADRGETPGSLDPTLSQQQRKDGAPVSLPTSTKKDGAHAVGETTSLGSLDPTLSQQQRKDGAPVSLKVGNYRSEGFGRSIMIRREIADTPHGARLFEVEVSGLRIGFITYAKKAGDTRGIEASLNGQGKRFAIVVSRFNSFITERLLDGALQALRQCGTKPDNITIVHVPGAFEIPAAARQFAESGQYNAIVCIGCLLRGGTLHYEVIANEVARGVGQSAQETGVPHSFGVLTCDTLEQAIDRAGLKAGNKGFEAALAAVEMASLRERVAELPHRSQGEEKADPSTSLRSGRDDRTGCLSGGKR
jgi:6,7-dimethyl-8-ribityllumazine synthase